MSCTLCNDMKDFLSRKIGKPLRELDYFVSWLRKQLKDEKSLHELLTNTNSNGKWVFRLGEIITEDHDNDDESYYGVSLKVPALRLVHSHICSIHRDVFIHGDVSEMLLQHVPIHKLINMELNNDIWAYLLKRKRMYRQLVGSWTLIDKLNANSSFRKFIKFGKNNELLLHMHDCIMNLDAKLKMLCQFRMARSIIIAANLDILDLTQIVESYLPLDIDIDKN